MSITHLTPAPTRRGRSLTRLSRVPKEQGVSQPVYEAWILSEWGEHERVEKTSFCGLNVCTRYIWDSDQYPQVDRITKPHDQDELSGMTLAAVDRYHAAGKRSLASRLLGGRHKSYERDLDERVRKLPSLVQSELDGLLGDRESATSNRFHRREWTVVMMREQYCYRFASAEYEEVNRKSRRFWKRNNAGRPVEYFFIIRGAEGKVATDDKGIHKTSLHGNPWRRVDAMEEARMQRARELRRFGKGFEGKGLIRDEWNYRERERSRSRSRSSSSSPVRPRRARVDPCDDEAFPLPNPFVPGHQADGFGGMSAAPRPPLRPFSCDYTPPMVAVPPGGMFPRGFAGEWMGEFCSSRPPPPPPPPPMSPPSILGSFPGFDDPPRPLPDFDYGIFLGDPPPLAVPAPGPAPTAQALGRPSSAWTFSGCRMCPQLRPADPAIEPLLARGLTGFAMPPMPPMPPLLPPQYTGCSHPSPPPAPRLSNLTTPTTFSAASGSCTGSSVDGTEISTPVWREDDDVRAVGSRPGSTVGS